MQCNKCKEQATHVIITEQVNKIYTVEDGTPSDCVSEFIEDGMDSEILGHFCEKCLAEETVNVVFIKTVK
jgi:hypothetical protein